MASWSGTHNRMLDWHVNILQIFVFSAGLNCQEQNALGSWQLSERPDFGADVSQFAISVIIDYFSVWVEN